MFLKIYSKYFILFWKKNKQKFSNTNFVMYILKQNAANN